MPTFDFTAPDGRTYSVSGPDGATPQQAFQMLQQHIGQPSGGVMAAIKDVPADMARTAVSMATTAGDTFNPSSEQNIQRAERLKNSTFLGGMSDIAQGPINLGKSVLAAAGLIPATLAAPITSVGGAIYDAAAPQFTPEQQKQMPQLPSGRDVMSTALLAARPASASPAGPVTKPAPVPTIDALKQSYKDVVNDPATKTASIPPADVSALSASVQNDLVNQGFRPTAKSAPDTFAELQRIAPGAGVTSINVDDLLAARRALGSTAMERDALGKPTPDSVAAKTAQGALDGLIEKYVPQMADANANYAAAKGAERLDFANAKAERRAAKSGAGMNLENTMRQEADKIPTRGLTPDQQAQLDQIVKGSMARNALRTVGKLGVDGGLSLTLNTMAAGATGGASIPITASATLARKVGELLTRRQMGNLSNSIRANTPLARSLPPVPVSGPNPLIGSIPVAQLPQAQSLLLRQLLGVMPNRADQQQ